MKINVVRGIGLFVVSLLSLTIAMTAPRAARAAKPLEGQALADNYLACWDHFNKRQWDEFAKCYDASSSSVAPGLPPAKGGQAIIESHSKPIAAAMPDVAGDIQLMLVSGRKAATVAFFHGTQTGPLKGPAGDIPATNKKIGQVVVHSIESGPGGIATKEWFIQDSGTMLAQLGVMKIPARAPLAKGWAERPVVVVAMNSKTEKQNLAALKKGYTAFNARNASGDVFADDVVDHDQAAPGDLVGKAAVVQFVEGLQKMSSNIAIKAQSSFAAGDYTVSINVCSGTNDGEMPVLGITKATKKPFKVDLIEVSRWQDGKIKDFWPFINGSQLAVQLGLMPAPPPMAAKK